MKSSQHRRKASRFLRQYTQLFILVYLTSWLRLLIFSDFYDRLMGRIPNPQLDEFIKDLSGIIIGVGNDRLECIDFIARFMKTTEPLALPDGICLRASHDLLPGVEIHE